MRLLLTADPEIEVPPRLYGGIERIVDVLVRRLRALAATTSGWSRARAQPVRPMRSMRGPESARSPRPIRS